MINHLLLIALFILSLSIAGCAYRLFKGPSMADRITALDSIGIHLLSMAALLCVLMRTRAYMDLVLVIGILTFIGTVALTRYLERGIVLESGDHRNDR